MGRKNREMVERTQRCLQVCQLERNFDKARKFNVSEQVTFLTLCL